MKTKFTILLILCVVAQTSIAYSQKNSNETIYLEIGQHTRLKVPTRNKVSVRGPKIVLLEDLNHELQVVGIKEGEVLLSSGTFSKRIVVTTSEKLKLLIELQNLLKKLKGLEVDIEEGKIVIFGELYRLKDWQDVCDVTANYNSRFVVKAMMAADVQAEVKTWINEYLTAKNFISPTIVFSSPVKAILAVEEKETSTQLKEELERVGITVEYEKSELAIMPLVRVGILVAEVNKTMQSQLGIEWPTSISASVIPKMQGPNQIEATLKAMEKSGAGQILASPNLLAKSGTEADFLAGGEFGIRVRAGQTRDVIWKRHGIYLKIKPTADRTGRINVELTSEVSLIDQASGVDGIPSLKTNRMATHFNLTKAQTIILSGLLRHDWGENREGLLGLSRIPVIGKLFSSENYLNNKSELVIFVTPEIVSENDPSNNPKMPKGWVNHE